MACNFRLPVQAAITQGVIALLGGLIWGSLSLIADDREPQPSKESQEIAELRTQLAVQQAQIEQLRKELQEQRTWLQRSTSTVAAATSSPIDSSNLTLASTGRKTTPMTNSVEVATRSNTPPMAPQVLSGSEAESKTAPLSFSIGATKITPVGFMDFTAVFRSKNVGSGLGTSFGTIPFSNSVNGNLSEYRLSAQNSRLGARLDSQVKGFQVLGYVEADFLGFVPGNSAVTTNSNSLRLRLYWARLSKSKFEFLAGQSWSMLTPNRVGISPLPADLFLTQDIDPNIQVGMTWARSPQFRVVFHPKDSLSVGFSSEAAEQYAGGSAGSAAITLPSALVPFYSGQLNTGSSGLGVPSPNQDLIGKIAFDHKAGGRPFHVEMAAILRRFEFYNPLTLQSFKVAGGGGSLNLNVELVKSLRLFSNNFYSDGGGRYIFGQGPDLIIQADGSPSLIHAYSMVQGLEYQARPKTLFYAYYGGAYFQKNVAIDPETGGPVGYGYQGSPSEHNRALQQVTAGFSRTFWRDPAYGALQFMTQYSYIFRHPWHVAPAQPVEANLNMLYLNLRYTLPGAPPSAR